MCHRCIFIAILLFGLTSLMLAQDINQTNYRYAPLHLNPALSGNYYGTMRIGANYRDEANAFLVNGYEAWSIYADMPYKFGFRKNDWIGFGIQAYGDKSGDLPLSTNGMMLNVAYHYAIDKKQKRILSLGIQYGLIQKKFDVSKAHTEESFLGPNSPDIDRLKEYDANTSDFNIGLTYKLKLPKNQSFIVGLSVYHLLKPKFDGAVDENFINQRITAHTNYYFKFNDRLYFQPEITASFSSKSYNIMPQFKAFYKIKKDTRRKTFDDKIYFGVGYRVLDALQLMVGFQYKDYDFGISYDITISSAAKYSNYQGGLEFGVYKILKIIKKPKVTPIIFCPRL